HHRAGREQRQDHAAGGAHHPRQCEHDVRHGVRGARDQISPDIRSARGAGPGTHVDGRFARLSSDFQIGDQMAKAYWISIYRAVHDPDALAAYAKLGVPALTAGGGRTLARGMPAQVYESGLMQRTVLIEFDSVAQAI